MDLIDRYVKAVSSRLPKKMRADVELELRSAIADAVEGRGASDDDEVAAVLREFGDPVTVAASYHPAGQYLIGPELYPSFVRVLQLALTAVVALAGLWLALRLATGRAEPMAAGDALFDTIELAIRGAIGVAVIVATTFVLLQRAGGAVADAKRAWDPRSLPALLDADRVSRVEAAFSLVVLAIAMAIVGAIGLEAQNGVDRAPGVLQPLVRGALIAGIPWLIASMLVEVVMQAGLMIEGRRRPWWRVLHVASDGLAVIAFAIAATAVAAEHAALREVGVPERAVTVLIGTLAIVALAIALTAILREWKLSRSRAAERTPAPSLPAVVA